MRSSLPGSRRAAACSALTREQHRGVGQQAAGAEVVDGAHGLGADAAHDALVDERAADEAVGDHGRAARQRGRDHVLDELRARGREQQRLGARARAAPCPRSTIARTLSPAGVPPGSRTSTTSTPARAQVLGEQPRLRRLARAVGTLERDEPQAVMLGVHPADGRR